MPGNRRIGQNETLVKLCLIFCIKALRKLKSYLKASLIAVPLILAIMAGYLIMTGRQGKKSLKGMDYACLIKSSREKYVVAEGERIPIHMTIQNRGRKAWSSKGKNPFFLSYHLLDENQNIIRYENRRFPFPRKVPPFQSVKIKVTIPGPLEKGKYILEFDLLREGVAWFKDLGSDTLKIALHVKERKLPEDKHDVSLNIGNYTRFYSEIDELNEIQRLIRLTLIYNEIKFKGKTGLIHGFSAGTDYPQIWLRDATTIIPASRFYYDESFLRSWLEEHLAYQKENGSLEDWIDSRGRSDKNTTETDQEASAVQAANMILDQLGPKWLEKTVGGEKIIFRLEKSLIYVLNNRFHPEYGLVTGAHTADWGDVDMVDSGREAIYTNERTHWTADIYDQSMFYQACLNMVRMLNSLGQREKSSFWIKKAEEIRKNTNRWLWQKDKGFYRIHIHLDSLRHDIDEEDIFAMGGNTTAIISGLASKEKCRKIIETALERQKKYRVSTISGTLLPPYPRAFFKHPLLDEPFEYQNGGQWDWFGGRLVYAMFECGFSRSAREKLIEIARKNIANRGLFEWDNREGIAQGSDFYCGSAGSLAKAIFEGYFGIKLKKDSLSIEPKLSRDSARIHVYQPSSAIFVAYEYSFKAVENVLIMKYNSNFPWKGKLKILSPWDISSNAEKELQKNLEVIIDGKEREFGVEKRNFDLFIVIETDYNNHTAEISLKNQPLISMP